jgi:hypothetical protein
VRGFAPVSKKGTAIYSQRLTLRQASDYLNVPQNTLRWWRTCNTGPRSYALGGKVFYDRGDLDAWVGNQKAGSLRGGAR